MEPTEEKNSKTVTQISKSLCFNGQQCVYEHWSNELGCQMKFGIFLPSHIDTNSGHKYPVLYFYAGLASNEETFTKKSGFQQWAEEYKLIVVTPDTRPRGPGVVEGEKDFWGFEGTAGCYVDATRDPWRKNYRMYSYVTKELLETVEANFPVDNQRTGVSGHSMGGHGALVSYFRNPDKFQSVSSLAGLLNPVKSPWGRRVFTGYLGENEYVWNQYDATKLVASTKSRPNVTILIDQGTDDGLLHYLVPRGFPVACEAAGQPINFRWQNGYDHDYYFVSTFIKDHIKHHAEALYAI